MISLSYLFESYIFSDKILVHNPELLHKSKIFIIGFSGSGKSTLGEYLAKKYDIKSVELDTLYWDISSDINGKSFNELHDKGFDSTLAKKELEKRVKNYKGNVILEGVHSMWMDRDFLLSNCIIIMGTSVLVSSYRAVMRNKDDEWSKEWSMIKILKDIYRNQKIFVKDVTKIKNDILKRNNYNIINSKEEL